MQYIQHSSFFFPSFSPNLINTTVSRTTDGRTDGHTCDQNLSLDCVRACVRACVLAFSYRRSQRVLIDMVHTVFDERKIEVDDTLCIRVARIVDDTGGIVIS